MKLQGWNASTFRPIKWGSSSATLQMTKPFRWTQLPSCWACSDLDREQNWKIYRPNTFQTKVALTKENAGNDMLPQNTNTKEFRQNFICNVRQTTPINRIWKITSLVWSNLIFFKWIALFIVCFHSLTILWIYIKYISG